MASLWLPAPTRTAISHIKNSATITKSTETANELTIASEHTSTNNSDNSYNNVSLPPQKPNRAPSYEERCNAALKWRSLSPEERKRAEKPFVPRSIKDFDDGGAFPEIHVAQYPLHMGNPHLKKRNTAATIESDNAGNTNKSENNHNKMISGMVTSSAIVNVEIDANGEISYDAIVKNGTNSDKKVYTKHSDLKGGEADPTAIQLPTKEKEAEVTAKTNAALMALLSKANTIEKPTGSAILYANTSANQESKTQFISYKPNKDAPGYNPSAKQRVIQMVPAQLDPMMPPKHTHKKAPRGPAEDPVPVLHAPPAKLSKEERAKWNVPACISNWKNSRGYTIPLDKRLAADGRALRETSVNPNFATLSESLYVAERQAREEVKMRARVQKQLVLAEKEKREADLRELANKARLERHYNATNQTKIGLTAAASVPVDAPKAYDNEDVVDFIQPNTNLIPHSHQDIESKNNTFTEKEDTTTGNAMLKAEAQRERIRIARKKERERELRLEKSGIGNDEKKKRRLEEERDVSEKIALGVHTGARTFDDQVDSRLYNQSAGLDSGFGAEDEYNTYTKPLFDRDAIAKNIYKPTTGSDGGVMIEAEEEYEKLKQVGTSKFQPDRGFAGVDSGGAVSAGPRNAPVQFEKGRS